MVIIRLLLRDLTGRETASMPLRFQSLRPVVPWQDIALVAMFTGTLVATAPCGGQSADNDNAAVTADDAEAVADNDPSETGEKSDPADVRAAALKALRDGDREAAIAAADSLVRNWPDSDALMLLAADTYLRAGKVELACKWFDRYVQRNPDQLPYLWQRGIALYFDRQYNEAARQFEVHREVNPNDVENAAWHFLCIAKSKSADQAERMTLPAPGDPRAPMQQVLEMLTSGDKQAVLDRVEALPAGSDSRASAEFYGNLYLGLYADALGRHDEAVKYMKAAAKDAPHHYMGDVARLYAVRLTPAPP